MVIPVYENNIILVNEVQRLDKYMNVELSDINVERIYRLLMKIL